jgi:hypothetical protein
MSFQALLNLALGKIYNLHAYNLTVSFFFPTLDWHYKLQIPDLPGWLIANKPEIGGVMHRGCYRLPYKLHI